MNEENVLIEWKGWIVDIFETDSGKLGITVTPPSDEAPEDKSCADIFIDIDCKVTGL